MRQGECLEEIIYVEEDGYPITRNGKILFIYGTISAWYKNKWWYDPGCMYMKNGDPGYPPEDDEEITIDSEPFLSDVIVATEEGDEYGQDILTETELKEFTSFMEAQLDDTADSHEWDYDGGR